MTEEVSTPLVLGAMMFGTRIDERSSFALLDRFVERGGVWIDTADCYAFWDSDTGLGGDSERLLGRWLAARPDVRNRVRLSTKIGAEPIAPGLWPDGRQGLSAAAVRNAFAGSLDRLGVDRIDRLWLHQEDRSTPIEETVEALGGLAADRFGVSNHPAWRVERARAHASTIGMQPVDALQLNATYLLPRPATLPAGVVHRFGVLSEEQSDYAAEHELQIWAYTPLLSGAYDNPAKEIPEAYHHPGNEARMAALDAVAAELGTTRGQTVLAWLVSRGIRPIIGGSKLHQLDSALEAVALRLTAEQRCRLDEADRSPWSSPYVRH